MGLNRAFMVSGENEIVKKKCCHGAGIQIVIYNVLSWMKEMSSINEAHCLNVFQTCSLCRVNVDYGLGENSIS